MGKLPMEHPEQTRGDLIYTPKPHSNSCASLLPGVSSNERRHCAVGSLLDAIPAYGPDSSPSGSWTTAGGVPAPSLPSFPQPPHPPGSLVYGEQMLFHAKVPHASPE